MKGLARNKDAIAAFLKTLEFAGGAQSGSRLFSDLAYEVQETVTPQVATQAKLPVLTGSTLTGSGGVPTGVIVWSIRGNYLPMAEFAPKPSPTPAPGAPAATGPAPNSAPAAPAVTPKPAA